MKIITALNIFIHFLFLFPKYRGFLQIPLVQSAWVGAWVWLVCLKWNRIEMFRFVCPWIVKWGCCYLRFTIFEGNTYSATKENQEDLAWCLRWWWWWWWRWCWWRHWCSFKCGVFSCNRNRLFKLLCFWKENQ